MGVPKFYRWLSERYPCLSEVITDSQIPEFDNLYLDMNGIIHNCSHPNDDDITFRISEEQIYQDIFKYIENLFNIIKPQKVFFMAVDGVAPRAKMNQQRARRFMSAKNADILLEKAKKAGEEIPSEKRFDSNCITPGTQFMVELQRRLDEWVQKKVNTDGRWRNMRVYLSGHNCPGEGEHKIMDFIRSERAKEGYDPNTRHCMYGLDADLIMLGMCSHEPHFSLLREEVKFSRPAKPGSKKKAPPPRKTEADSICFHLLHLSILREYLPQRGSARGGGGGRAANQFWGPTRNQRGGGTNQKQYHHQHQPRQGPMMGQGYGRPPMSMMNGRGRGGRGYGAPPPGMPSADVVMAAVANQIVHGGPLMPPPPLPQFMHLAMPHNHPLHQQQQPQMMNNQRGGYSNQQGQNRGGRRGRGGGREAMKPEEYVRDKVTDLMPASMRGFGKGRGVGGGRQRRGGGARAPCDLDCTMRVTDSEDEEEGPPPTVLKLLKNTSAAKTVSGIAVNDNTKKSKAEKTAEAQQLLDMLIGGGPAPPPAGKMKAEASKKKEVKKAADEEGEEERNKKGAEAGAALLASLQSASSSKTTSSSRKDKEETGSVVSVQPTPSTSREEKPPNRKERRAIEREKKQQLQQGELPPPSSPSTSKTSSSKKEANKELKPRPKTPPVGTDVFALLGVCPSEVEVKVAEKAEEKNEETAVVEKENEKEIELPTQAQTLAEENSFSPDKIEFCRGKRVWGDSSEVSFEQRTAASRDQRRGCCEECRSPVSDETRWIHTAAHNPGGGLHLCTKCKIVKPTESAMVLHCVMGHLYGDSDVPAAIVLQVGCCTCASIFNCPEELDAHSVSHSSSSASRKFFLYTVMFEDCGRRLSKGDRARRNPPPKPYAIDYFDKGFKIGTAGIGRGGRVTGQERLRPSAASTSRRPPPLQGLSLCTKATTTELLLGGFRVLNGDPETLPPEVQRFVAEKAELMRPRGIYICDGSEHESEEIMDKLVERGMMYSLKAYHNNYICRTDPRDVARVDSKTWMATSDKYETVCRTPEGVEPLMGHWMSPEDLSAELDSRFSRCMTGRIMYIIPFSMGPVGGPLSKIGVQLTDSKYVVLSMRIMTRVTRDVFDILGNSDFTRCIHSVGLPRPVKQRVINHWPCNPERVLIGLRPPKREIWSFGSGYGDHSMLGKKCFALRIASNIAKDEGWMAENMLIIGVTRPCGQEHFIAAAFPSACGKTNFAMLEPTLRGWEVRCVADDIAWMKFGADDRLYAINPEAGVIGVAPGTSKKTNPMAVATFKANSIFTNVAETADGEYYWEGMEDEVKDKNVDITTWLGKEWHIGDRGVAAHPNSRFAAPARQCPIIHPKWEDPQGVPIDAIIFGGRRPEGVPLVFETNSWQHGIYTGACLKSETTAVPDDHYYCMTHEQHDPMAMRPFMGYNFGEYLQHWIDLDQPGRKMPSIYHVNWFRKGSDGKFLWPGYGDNIRVIDWIIKRLDGVEGIGIETPIGTVPTPESLNLEGLEGTKLDELLSVPKEYWTEDAKEVRAFFESQVGADLPAPIRAEMDQQEERIKAM